MISLSEPQTWQTSEGVNRCDFFLPWRLRDSGQSQAPAHSVAWFRWPPELMLIEQELRSPAAHLAEPPGGLSLLPSMATCSPRPWARRTSKHPPINAVLSTTLFPDSAPIPRQVASRQTPTLPDRLGGETRFEEVRDKRGATPCAFMLNYEAWLLRASTSECTAAKFVC